MSKVAGKKYSNVPLDAETYRRVKVLAQAKGFGERGHAAVVRALVNTEYEKWDAVKLVDNQASEPTGQAIQA